jgi:hypothetical protein
MCPKPFLNSLAEQAFQAGTSYNRNKGSWNYGGLHLKVEDLANPAYLDNVQNPEALTAADVKRIAFAKRADLESRKKERENEAKQRKQDKIDAQGFKFARPTVEHLFRLGVYDITEEDLRTTTVSGVDKFDLHKRDLLSIAVAKKTQERAT